ncbi:uncharacterized protein LOC118754257 [Rhagoletis pomonella]|uniref:uncharacterized protein LOC118754193 n=1 Tax=Rhagoletis pomonella TaxID=28610 RepID=UPI00177E8C51|nr:uncharacterized protein LOC118754193 [Rhagoletis pomonella]XP_036345016.1 uncharacterized protein LOC118754257 [Rhagoletis pomonella]
MEDDEAWVDATAAPRISSPNMTATNIESYFMSLEFWFAASGPTEQAAELRSIIDTVPQQNRYEYVKARLTSHFADSQQRRLQRVLSDMPLGDMKPSQLFNEMRRVAGDALGEAVLLDLWAIRLPPHAQAAVIAVKGNAVDKGVIADAIVESMGLRTVSSVDKPTATASPVHHSGQESSSALEAIQREIAQLSRRFESLQTRGYDPRRRSRSRGRLETPRRRARCNSPNESCWYYREFGANARKCRTPCGYVRKNSGQ